MKEVWREPGDSKYNKSYIKIRISFYLESNILFIIRLIQFEYSMI